MATSTASPPIVRIDHEQLRSFLRAIRLQLWWRDALAVAAASAVAGAIFGVIALLWPARATWMGEGTLVAAWLMVAAIGLGAVVALVRRPTVVRAARVADRQLSTSSRLATAAEVLDGRLGGSLAPAQLDDAWRTASGIQPFNAFPHTWRSVQVALAIVGVSLIVLSISLGGVLTPVDVSGLAGVVPQVLPQTEDLSQTADATAAMDVQAIAADLSNNPTGAAQTLEDLQAAAAASQAAEAALQKLGDALRSTAAARDVGEALRRGDYDDASNKLVKLGNDADQLSRISKRELANAMARVAVDSAKLDPPLAVSEERVARALNRQVYTETKAALEDLARTVSDVKNGVVSQEALARELSQLQEQQPQVPGGGGGNGEDEEYIPDVPGEEPGRTGLVRGASSTIQVPGPEGDPRTANRSSAGLNAGGDPLGDLQSRLNVPPVDINVDTALVNDKGRDKAAPGAPTVKISETNQSGVRQSNVAQPGDPVQDVAEQTIEPTAHRDAVRAFFKSTGDTPPADKAP